MTGLPPMRLIATKRRGRNKNPSGPMAQKAWVLKRGGGTKSSVLNNPLKQEHQILDLWSMKICPTIEMPATDGLAPKT